jgi:hypothetical protein
MKRTLIAAAGFALLAASGLAGAASWTVIVQPGVYGRVAIGGYAEPPMVYAPQPVIAVDNGYGQVVEESVDAAYATDQPPVYLWVPEYQRTHWAQYCREYGAYGVPVYFVDDGWYRANVMRRNWTPEQRSWSQQQWLEQDRLARDRFERQRFEQQRYEQQRRWDSERAWRDPRQQRHDDDPGAQQARWDHDHDRDHADQDAQNHMRWGSARGAMPQQPQPAGQGARPQPGAGRWQPGAGQWQPGGNGGRAGGYAPGNGGDAGQQPSSASQPHGGQGMPAPGAGERRGDDRDAGRGERGDRGDRHGQGEARGGFEHGHGGRRDR